MEPQDPHAGGGEHAADHDDGYRDQLDVGHPPERIGHDEQADHARGRQDQLAGLFGSGVAPHPSVQAEDVVGHQGEDEDQTQEGGEMLPVETGCLVPEVGDLGQAVADDDAQGVEAREDQAGADPTGPDGHVPAGLLGRRDAVGRVPEFRVSFVRCPYTHALAPLLK